MKLTCPQSQLNTHLALVSRVVSSRPTLPILANILFVADLDSQQVSLTGFDLNLGVQTSFGADVETGGRLTLPAKLLLDIVSRLPEGEITLEGDTNETLVTLTCSTGNYQVRGMNADEYPELPMVEGEDVIDLPVDALIEGLRGSLFAASGDESKQVLTGVHLLMEAEELEFAATDGHRLAVVQTLNPTLEDATPKPTNAKGNAPAFDVIVPGKALRELERMLQMQSTETIAVHFDQGQLVVKWTNQRSHNSSEDAPPVGGWTNRRLTSRLLEGQYPNYRQLIPRQFSRQMTIERRSLLGALERISVLADQRNSIVKFTLDSVKQELVVSVDAQDVGNGREAAPAQISGDDLEIAFNVKYLLEGLKVMNTSEVQMQFNTPTSPSVLSPLGGTKMTYLVMPVQVRS
ncbi:MAG: DNA polymerase III subunit beta [Leptolyngbyaceae cyanobacterium SL_7_1]|nr:DNA polymerase III subunit beta [Leptolyngbyaceae cyanobacterium SL_7_1]